MRVLICGDRNWQNEAAIRRELSKLDPGTAIIHGGARGADTLAGIVAKEIGLQVEVYPADWNRHGRAAGPIRNQQMIEQGRPDIVLAFHANIGQSKGTKDMVERAKKTGIPSRTIEG